MSNIKHTPGPWEAAYGIGAGWTIKGTPNINEFTVYNFDEGQKIPVFTLRKEPEKTPFMDEQWIQFPIREWEEMQKANARLIAAAPELLELLRQATQMLESSIEVEDEHHPGIDDLAKECREAIKKATT